MRKYIIILETPHGVIEFCNKYKIRYKSNKEGNLI